MMYGKVSNENVHYAGGFRSMDGLEKSKEREIWDAVFVLNACTMNRGSNF